jgi:hypothetical protein
VLEAYSTTIAVPVVHHEQHIADELDDDSLHILVEVVDTAVDREAQKRESISVGPPMSNLSTN